MNTEKLATAASTAKEHAEKTRQFVRGLFNLDRATLEAEDMVEDCFTRHDVPQGPHVLPDLKDEQGDMLVTADGHTVTSRLSMDDVTIGSESPALPIYLACFPLSFLAMKSFSLFGFPVLAYLPVVAYFSFLFLFAGVKRFMAFTFLMGIAPLLLFVLPLVLPFGLGRQLLGQAGVTQLIGICAVVIPASLCLILKRLTNRDYARNLAETANATHSPLISSIRNTNNEARTKQLAAALQDKTYPIDLGQATGTLTAHGDPFAPDRGLPFRQTVQDVRTNFIFIGAQGTGKTTGIKNEYAGIVKEELWEKKVAHVELTTPWIQVPVGDRETMKRVVDGEEFDKLLEQGKRNHMEVEQANADADAASQEAVKEAIGLRSEELGRALTAFEEQEVRTEIEQLIAIELYKLNHA